MWTGCVGQLDFKILCNEAVKQRLDAMSFKEYYYFV